ncbi:hypothetical protein BJV77DRAFT_1068252 [Russula vinacea]|nr:hypothetical protein BJV77DRAFT_1068252 [Russula vinacea]
MRLAKILTRLPCAYQHRAGDDPATSPGSNLGSLCEVLFNSGTGSVSRVYSPRRLTVIVSATKIPLRTGSTLSHTSYSPRPNASPAPNSPPPDEVPEKRQKFSVHAPSRRPPVCSTTALSAVMILMASKIIAALDAANILGCVRSRQLPVRSDMLSPFPFNLAMKKTCPPPPLSPSQTDCQTRMQMLSAEAAEAGQAPTRRPLMPTHAKRALRPPFCVLHKRHIPN